MKQRAETEDNRGNKVREEKDRREKDRQKETRDKKERHKRQKTLLITIWQTRLGAGNQSRCRRSGTYSVDRKKGKGKRVRGDGVTRASRRERDEKKKYRVKKKEDL